MNTVGPSNHRKLILQQLLQKSEMFTAYFHHINSNEAHVLNMPFNSNKNQQKPYGTCQIVIPQRIVQSPKKFNRKVMIVSKSKGQKNRLTQKEAQIQEHIRALHEKANKLRIDSARQRKQSPQSLKQKCKQKTSDKDEQNKQEEKVNNIRQSCLKTKNSSKAQINSNKERQNQQFIQICQQKFVTRPNKSFSCRIQSAKYKKSQIQNQIKSPQQIYQQFNRKILSSQNKREIKNYPSTTNAPEQNFENNEKEQQFLPRSQTDQTYNYLISDRQKEVTSGTFRKQYQLLLSKNYQKKLEEQKKHKITFRKQVNKTYTKTFIPPPKISARSYVIYQMKTQTRNSKFLATYNGKNTQQVASLTKIMTCILILEISKNIQVNLDQQFVEIGKFQSNISGTSAQIKSGQIYKVSQLLYGLMLPSGNDASLALGVWGGKKLKQFDKKTDYSSANNQTRSTQDSNSPLKMYKKDYVIRFIQEMNRKAQKLGMTKTNYTNTHGLVNCQSKSSAVDIAILCQYCMQNQKFQNIVGTKSITFDIMFKEDTQNNENSFSNNMTEFVQRQINRKSLRIAKKQVTWQNTHKLLHSKFSDYIGIKTGVTTAAGPCLASCIHHKESGRKFIVVVLDCRKLHLRFKQTQILRKWIYKQQNLTVRIKRRAKSINGRQQSEQNEPEWDQNSQQQNEKLDQKMEIEND